MKAFRPRRGFRGYTLIELTLAMSIGITISVLLLAMVNQQLAFLRIFNVQGFLATEAPQLNNYVAKLIGSADSYALYGDVDALVSGSGQVMGDAPVIVLRFKEPDGTFRASVLSFEDPGTGRGLYYRMVNSAGVLGTPEWALSKTPENVRFSIEQGILRVRVTGPNGEELVYSGAQQL